MLKEMLGATEVTRSMFERMIHEDRDTQWQEPLNECARRELPSVRRAG